MFTMTEISMNSANHLKIEVVTLTSLFYFLSSDVTTLIHIQVKKWACKTQKSVIFLICLLSYVSTVSKVFI